MEKREVNHSIKTQQFFVLHTSTDLFLAAADEETTITLYSLNNINSKPLHTFENEYQSNLLFYEPIFTKIISGCCWIGN